MYVVQAVPIAANANPVSTTTGMVSTAHHDEIRPISSMTTTNETEYIEPRASAQVISPSATSAGVTGVARTASYSLLYFSLKNRLNVASMIAPFMALAASIAGATNAV